MNMWQRWLRQPQSVWLRKAVFQIHLWSGLALGAYIVVICLSGSVLVYRNELYRHFAAKPTLVSSRGTPLSADQLKLVVRRSNPQWLIGRAWIAETPNQAVEIEMTRGDEVQRRLIDPYTGADLGHAVPAGMRATFWLLELHDNLLSGTTGRRVNGGAAMLVILLGLTGVVIWWPGLRRWRRSMFVETRGTWKQVNWNLHSVFGIWFVGFILMWGITGVYLSYPQPFSTAADYFEPFDDANPDRFVDHVLFWLGYAHFGRFGGRLPGCSRGTCDDIFKAIWALVGLVPVVMATTGVTMWWNRVLKNPRRPRSVPTPTTYGVERLAVVAAGTVQAEETATR
jgi:uncharacterized iron-regulated membrane protein